MIKKLLLLALLFYSTLTAGIPVTENYQGPTEQLIHRESWKTIEKELSKIKIPKDLFPYFDTIASYEDWGHIGYHGATQDYRVYQDVIRFTVEEILDIPIRDDFHFLRVPGDSDLNLNSIKEFKKYWGDKIDNKSDKRAKQLLSMNFAIYSNFDVEGSCSINLFVKNKSKTDVNYAKQLVPFYKNLGITDKALTELFNIADKYLPNHGGILLQISEHSHLVDPNNEAYNFADKQTYPCKRGGHLYDNHLISNHFTVIMSTKYSNKKAEIAPQLRLLMNNRYTLNPYSYIDIQRWDLHDEETITKYETEMRNSIRRLKYDSVKVEKYRNKLLDKWAD